MKHTPAPWHVEPVFNALHIIPDHEAGFTIASLRGDYIEREANARLIAAAPELLAFVQSYVDRFGAKHADEVDSPMVAQAKTLIAKAEGKS